MPWIITRTDTGKTEAFTLRGPREYGSAAGAWKQGEEKALQFARQVDAESFVETYLAHAAMLIETTETRHG